ncbi:MAG: MBL fold metallo-hydrolase [Bifidobacteriaceae bacterium]|jgi:glyoxylase-like metal-dependent hydrolase (beta-lactamase superfamily II)|nr:MBL fold metallo-hydrolase [Bifidobacteriaceae bacterium]
MSADRAWAGGRVAASTACVLAPNPSAMTLEGTNTWIWFGDGVCALADPGPDVDGHLDRVVQASGWPGVAVAAILLTHHHADHSAGAAALSRRTGAPVLAWRDGSLGEGVVPLGDRRAPRLQVAHLPGHTEDSVGIIFAQDRAIATGDLVFDRGSAMIDWPDGSLRDYLRTLDRLAGLVADLGLELILPGHGGVIADPAAQIGRYRAHRLERLDQIGAALGKLGAGAAPEDADLVDGIVRRVYGQIPPELAEAARRTVRAQLEHLRDQR